MSAKSASQVIEGTSLRQIARIVGVTEKAIRKGIAAGRMPWSVRKVAGRPVIVDLALARQEWESTSTRPVRRLMLDADRESALLEAGPQGHPVDHPEGRFGVLFDGAMVVVGVDVTGDDEGWIDVPLTRAGARRLAAAIVACADATESEID
jgi:hypothetical protein